MEGESERRDKIRLLSITIEGQGPGRNQRVANLLHACPQLERLQLLGTGAFRLGSWRFELGKPLSEALYTLERLKTFELSNSSNMTLSLGGDNLISYLSSWPQLTTLLLSAVSANTQWSIPSEPYDVSTIPSLHKLQLRFDGERCSSVFLALLKASESTLRELDIGAVVMNARDLEDVNSEVKSALAKVAPQLKTLDAVFQCQSWDERGIPHPLSNSLMPMLVALRDVESLALGNFGISFATILSILQHLPRLRLLFITSSRLATRRGPFQEMTSQSVVKFTQRAGASALREVTLPWQMREVWTMEESKAVRIAAGECRVRLNLG